MLGGLGSKDAGREPPGDMTLIGGAPAFHALATSCHAMPDLESLPSSLYHAGKVLQSYSHGCLGAGKRCRMFHASKSGWQWHASCEVFEDGSSKFSTTDRYSSRSFRLQIVLGYRNVGQAEVFACLCVCWRVGLCGLFGLFRLLGLFSSCTFFCFVVLVV